MDFNPLNDAIAFNDEKVKVEINRPFEIEMKSKVFNLDEGTHNVPMFLAVFLIGRGFGNII
jgi:hypothetical protein